jgi:hypothetical protein
LTSGSRKVSLEIERRTPFRLGFRKGKIDIYSSTSVYLTHPLTQVRSRSPRFLLVLSRILFTNYNFSVNRPLAVHKS